MDTDKKEKNKTWCWVDELDLIQCSRLLGLLVIFAPLLLLFLLLGWDFSIMEVIAAATALLKKLGSAAIAAVTESANEPWGSCGFGPSELSASWDICNPENFDWLYIAWLKIWGRKDKFWDGFCNWDWIWLSAAATGCSWVAFVFCVKSNVTVGNGAEAEIVAMLLEHGRKVLARKFGFIKPSALDIDPERSIRAADEVVAAIAIAAGGSRWLWFPSYVVIRIVRSSAHLCTYKMFQIP